MGRERHLHPHGWRRRFRHSLKWRLITLFVLMAVAIGGLFFAGSRQAFSGGWRAVVGPLVADYSQRLTLELGSPPERAKAEALVARLPLQVRIEGPVLNWDSHPDRHVPQRFGPGEPGHAPWIRQTADGHTVSYGLTFSENWGDRPRWIALATLAALAAVVWAGFGYVRRLFRPVDDIRAGAERYGRGDFATPIPVRCQDELGDLAGQVNTMAADLGRMLESQRSLLLAISHELRSPLTRARLNAELVDEGPARDALLRDLNAMRDLIGDLLETERLAAGGGVLQKEPTDLDALVRERVAAEFAERPPTLALAAGVPLALDRGRAALVIRNLLDNAWRHTPEGAAAPEVRTRDDGAMLVLTVRDHGPGVSDAQLSQLAQPFFRTDEARTRHAGGVGLGLALCRLVARSHGGELVFRQGHPGLVAEVTWPRG